MSKNDKKSVIFISLSTILIASALIAIIIEITNVDFSRLLLQLSAVIISILATVVTFVNYMNKEKISSVDERRRTEEHNLNTIIKNSNEQTNNNNLIADYELVKKNQEELYKNFSSYFNGIKVLLENKASDADEKASILLDKGIKYSLYGIVFFIMSIIAWQILSINFGFREHYVYGIVSCSILFIFVEFLSAWFLKQYRNYVDTSTYLIKIKSIFDRYMLVYLVLDDKNKNTNELINLLSDDIKWPETYLLKSGDISFAKEAFETMSYFVQQAKKEAKNKKDTE